MVHAFFCFSKRTLMNKTFFAIVSAVFLLGQTIQAEERNALVVHLKDGTSTTFLLDDQPRVSIVNEQLRVQGTSLSVEFPREEVLRFTYAYDNSNGVSLAPIHSFWGGIHGDVLSLSGLQDGLTVRLISVDGKLLSETVVAQDGKVKIPLDAYPTGVYVLQTKGIIHKFTKP